MDRDRPFRLAFRKPKASEIFLVDLNALTSIRPPGSLSTEIFSPGRTPRCSSTSLRKVTWPFRVTVSVLMVAPDFWFPKSKAKKPCDYLVRGGVVAQPRRGLSFQVAARIAAVIKPVMMAAIGMESARAAVAAQPIDENASAKVASRDEVWRRRN